MVPKTKWTILTYIAAHNDLQFFGKRSYDEMIAVGSTPEVVHGVLFDWPDGAARYIVGSPGHVQRQEQLANYDAGDPDRLIETARWVFNQYPAEHYGLVLWSHGSGWQPHEIELIAKQARGDNTVDRKESTERAAAPGSMALFRSTLKTIVSKEKAAERAICFDDRSVEELLKPLGVWLFAGNLESPAQGFALGELSGGAFALVETFGSIDQSTDWASLVGARVATGLMHILTTGLMGWGIHLAWREHKDLMLMLAYSGSFLIHSAWNGTIILYSLSTAAKEFDPTHPFGRLSPIAFSIAILLSAIMLGILGFANRKLRQKYTSTPAQIVESIPA